MTAMTPIPAENGYSSSKFKLRYTQGAYLLFIHTDQFPFLRERHPAGYWDLVETSTTAVTLKPVTKPNANSRSVYDLVPAHGYVALYQSSARRWDNTRHTGFATTVLNDDAIAFHPDGSIRIRLSGLELPALRARAPRADKPTQAELAARFAKAGNPAPKPRKSRRDPPSTMDEEALRVVGWLNAVQDQGGYAFRVDPHGKLCISTWTMGTPPELATEKETIDGDA